MFANAAPHAAPRGRSVDFGAGLSPEPRLLWDTLDTTLRERIEHVPFVGEDERVVARRMSGEQAASTLSMEALARLGYSGLAEPAVAAGRASSPTALTSTGGATRGCWTFTGETGGCSDDCADEMFEDVDGFCDTFLSCDSATRSMTGVELDALAREVEGDESLGFKRGPRIKNATADEEALITAAWNLILANLDLVKWSVCKTTGSVSTTEFSRLQDCINGKKPRRVTVRIVDFKGGFMAAYGTSIIWVGRDKDAFHGYLEMWTAGTDTERLCAALDLAASLLHEMTRLAGYTLWDFDLFGGCFSSYLIDNTFRWGLFHRYSGAATGCCGKLAVDDVFGCGSPVYPDFNDCSSDGSASSMPGGLVDGFWGIFGFLWDVGRLAIGFTLGTIWRGIEEAWDLFIGLVKDLWGFLGDAVDDVVDWLSSKWRSLLEWFGGILGGDGGGGGCCSCQCNPCYEYCPDLYNNDCNCTAKKDADEDALLACTVRCTEGMMEEMMGPASTESVTGE